MNTKEITIIANWKTNPATFQSAQTLADQYSALVPNKNIQIVVCPPPIFQTLALSKNIHRGAQDVHSSNNATGGWNTDQLISLGVTHCIIGHSERRAQGETDISINTKLHILLSAGITPIVCIGELERDEKMQYITDFIAQLRSSFSGVTRAELEHCIVAYEPIWAIGVNSIRPCTPEECKEMILLIQRELIEMTGNLPIGAIRVVYGGSVNAENAKTFIHDGGCDGLLIGRTSLNSAEIKTLVESLI